MNFHGNRIVRRQRCVICDEPSVYHAAGGVNWDLCRFHGMCAAMCGFTVWDRLGELITRAQAIVIYQSLTDSE